MSPAPHAAPRSYDDQSLPALLLGSAEPVIVESHFAGWVTPWRALDDAAWQELQREFGERVNCGLVETGANREVAVRYGLEVLPEVLVFLGGKPVARFHGKVRVADVIAAVRDAWREEHARDEALQELETATSPRTPATLVRSVLRRRPGTVSVAILARAG